jgi:para-nitrobenzyl esterase
MEAAAEIVQTDAGPVRGTVTDECRLFQGVPYAASTAGALRWRPPEPVPAWTEPRDATGPCSICPQQPSSYAAVASLDEDCLCLNVVAARSATPAAPRPVMVWIHGDGAIGGGSFVDGRPLAVAGDMDRGPSASRTSRRRCAGWPAPRPRSAGTRAT